MTALAIPVLKPTDRITLDKPLDGGLHETTWREFVEDNRDCLDEAELMGIAIMLALDGAYDGIGGDHTGPYSIRKVPMQ